MGDQIKVFFLLLAVGLLAYANAIFHPFVHDDVVFIRDNPTIADLKKPLSFFVTPPRPVESLSIINTYYRPFLEIFYRLEYRIFGLNPAGYHFVNILVHIINGFLVFLIGRSLFSERVVALGAVPLQLFFVQGALAMIFLVHPVQSEAVASIVGISNLLSALWVLLSFYFYMKSREGKNFICFQYLAAMFFFISLTTKESAVVVPLLLGVYELCFPIKEEAFFKKWLRLLPILIIFGGYMWIRRFVVGGMVPSVLEYEQEFVLRLLAVPGILATYVSLIFFPIGLHYYRCADILRPWLGPALACLAIFVLALVMIARLRDQRRVLVFGFLWFLLSLAPTLNIVPLINEYSLVLAAEHFLYFPLVGFLLFAGGVVIELLSKKQKERVNQSSLARAESTRWKQPAVIGCAAVVFILIVITVRQNSFWRSEVALFERTLKFEKDFGRGHILLGRAYYFKQNWAKALRHYQKALEIMSGYLSRVDHPEARRFYLGFIKGIYFDRAHIYEARGEMKKALDEYRRALDIDSGDHVLYNSAGVVSLRLGEMEAAQIYFKKAIDLNPKNFMAMTNLAVCYIYQGEFKIAEELLGRVLRLNPNFQQARINLEKLKGAH